MGTGNDWQRLAGFVLERRGDLGLTQEEVAGAGGPSISTLRLIEGARQSGYRPRILRDLERALGWERGSVRAILAGGDPVPVGEDGPTLPGIPPVPAAPADQMARLSAEQFAEELYRCAALIRREITAARAAGVTEGRIFRDRFEQDLWTGQAALLTPEDQRVLAIAWLRSVRPARPPRTGNPPVELAG